MRESRTRNVGGQAASALTVSAGAQRRWGYACGGLFAVMTLLGFIALIASTRIDWKPMLDQPATRTIPAPA